MPAPTFLRAAAVAASGAALVLAAACGSSAPPTPGAAAATAPATAEGQAGGAAAGGHSGHGGGHHGGGAHGGAAVELYAVQTSTLGVVVTDGEGRLLYGSAADTTDPPTSRCTGDCAQTWLPVVVPAGQEPQLLGVDADEVGKLGLPDGSSQLTLSGWPLYVNANDTGELKAAAPGAAGGAWFAFTPQGQKVTM